MDGRRAEYFWFMGLNSMVVGRGRVVWIDIDLGREV